MENESNRISKQENVLKLTNQIKNHVHKQKKWEYGGAVLDSYERWIKQG